MKLRRFWQGLLFTAFFFTGLAAHAGLILTLEDDDGNSVSVSDNGTGYVQYISTPFDEPELGTWTINTTTGISDPWIGSDHVDEIDLNSINVSGGSGTLTITLTRTGLDRYPANWITDLGGTTSGTIDFSLLLNDEVVSGYLASSGAFSWSDSGQLDALEPYSLSLVAKITHDGERQTSSFDYFVAVPEPSTMALLGSGLMLTGWMGMRRKRQSI